MNYINKNILEKELFYEDVLILKYYIEYPSIVNEESFNNYNKKIANRIKEKSENEIYNQAVETYKYNKQNGYPIMVYEVYVTYEVTYNMYNIVSLYSDKYIFAGGAHGNTVRISQNWNLYQNCMLELADFFPNNPYFILNILREINKQISEDKEIYFENSCDLVIETFNPQNFYITPNGIVVYFGQYDIAPYSSGIREFLIKY